MNKSLELDLISLLPSLAGPIPLELLDLATSLLAQSRTRISNLKPQEEVARSYVCAHIACNRLKNSLDLPSIVPRPPLPKRAYDSLVSHFKKSLATSTSTSCNRSTPGSPVPPSNTSFSTLDPTLEAELKALCTRLNIPAAQHHVLTGVASILAAPENANVKGLKTIHAIVVAVTILVVERLCPYQEDGGDIHIQVGDIRWKRGVGYKAKQEEIIAVLLEVSVKGRAKGVSGRAVGDWIQNLSKQGFRKWSWMELIPDGGGVGGVQSDGRVEIGEVLVPPKETAVKKVGERKVAKMDAIEKVLQEKEVVENKKRKSVEPVEAVTKREKTTSGDAGGGGRMLQERVDYLGERKRKAFELWKRQVLERCDEIGGVSD
ncbi:hypothetical protein K440DRAFT_601278 [Wilcoxina mikolae CBS 423.85]|nr:hypothetical protein K440DRAFT_601278 [Wilcoxina mikolae CBS 423.85]